MRTQFIIISALVLTLVLLCLDNKDRIIDRAEVEMTTEIPPLSGEIVVNKEFDSEKNELEERFISPVGYDIYNNGGTVLLYGDCVYFYMPNVNRESKALYVMRENESEKHHLFNIKYQKSLYAVDEYILTYGITKESDFNNVYSSDEIIRFSVKTGAIDYLDYGSLEYVDVEKKEIYYSVYNSELKEEGAGLYKMNINGSDKKKLCPDGYTFLGKVGDLIYLQAPYEENSNKAVLSSINSDGTDLKILANISAKPHDIYDVENQHIYDFGICEDWIILSVGSFQGTGEFFYGGMVRMKKDGTEIERFYGSDIFDFIIKDNWIYINDGGSWNLSDREHKKGCYRLYPDLSQQEYLGEEIHKIHAISTDNSLYYNYCVNLLSFDGYYYHYPQIKPAYCVINDLRKYDLENGDITTLFHGENAPRLEDSNYIDYLGVQEVGKYIYFGVDVHGLGENDWWRGHNCYYAYYRVLKNGNNLELLYEDKNSECPKP